MARLAASLGALLAGTARAASLAARSQDTPVTRVVNLLKEMSTDLQSDMEADEATFSKLNCWCTKGRAEKEESIRASSALIGDRQAQIEGSAARSSELQATIKELQESVAAGTQALAEATSLREQQLADFHGLETDSVQAIENLKAALAVLAKHHDASLIDSGGADVAAFVQLGSFPWGNLRQDRDTKDLDNFLGSESLGAAGAVEAEPPAARPRSLRRHVVAALATDSDERGRTALWSFQDTIVLKQALASAAAFLQAKHKDGTALSYDPQSGEILGVLKQLKEEMEADLSEAQQHEKDRGVEFQKLSGAKKAELSQGQAMLDEKMQELANMDNTVAEAKDDLEKETKVLAEDQNFLANLKEMCSKGSADFDERKQARLEELKAVGETIEILMEDEARDAMSNAFSFAQVAARRAGRRSRAAALLRRAAGRAGSLDMTVLATSVEVDAFVKVNEAINGMLKNLELQNADEVKKNDWCKGEIHGNEMDTSKAKERSQELEAKGAEHASRMGTLQEELDSSNLQIKQLQADLQQASKDRKEENLEFQRTIADQTMTIEVLHKALDRLSKFYGFVQESGLLVVAESAGTAQQPPVPQQEYKKSAGGGGVMSMLQKLIGDAEQLMEDAKNSETNAQHGYEKLVADTNGSVGVLHEDVAAKSQAVSGAEEDKLSAASSLRDNGKELEGLVKEGTDLQQECSYILKNFDVRQRSRTDEMQALHQAQQILSGAAAA